MTDEAMFEKELVYTVKSIRARLQSIENLEAFTFQITAEGRVHDGEVRITFKLDHPYETGVDVRGNSIGVVLDEFMRRHGWNKRHTVLLITNGASDELAH